MDTQQQIVLAAFADGWLAENVAQALKDSGFQRSRMTPVNKFYADTAHIKKRALIDSYDEPRQSAEESKLTPFIHLYEPFQSAKAETSDTKPNHEHRDTMSAAEGILDGGVRGAALGGAIGLATGVAAILIPGVLPALAADIIVSTSTGLAVGTTLGGIHGALTGINLTDFSVAGYDGLLDRGFYFVAAHCVTEIWTRQALDICNENGPELISICSEGELESLMKRETSAEPASQHQPASVDNYKNPTP